MHSGRRDLEVPLKIRFGRGSAIQLRVRMDECQILTLLGRKPGARWWRWIGGLRDRLLVGVPIQYRAEPIADSVEYTLHCAVVAVIRLGGDAAKKIIDVVQSQVHRDLRADRSRALQGSLHFRV